jgi:catechol 2,3-dioxygenase-like lactoylglutathione lyase family enzyme
MTACSSLQTGHVGLNVTDLDRSAAFYQQVLGFRVMLRSEGAGGRFAFLGDGDRLVLTLWQQAEGEFDARRPGLHHLSFQAGTMSEVREKLARLRELGVPLIYDGVVPHAEGGPSGGVFFRDPDGLRLEIFSPTGAEGHHAPGEGPSCGFF